MGQFKLVIVREFISFISVFIGSSICECYNSCNGFYDYEYDLLLFMLVGSFSSNDYYQIFYFHATWVFGPVVISFPKSPPL